MSSATVDQPAPVRSGEELDLPRLEAYLREQLPHLDGDLEVEQFPRGYSNLTYLLRMGGDQMVLRRPPFGADVRGGHDMGREHRILGGLQGHYPKAPRPLLFCDDLRVLGSPFYVMERVEGVILRPRSESGQTLPPAAMGVVAGALVETLAELHRVDYEAAALADLGRPDGYVRRQIEGWTGRYAKARTDDVAEMDHLALWLAEQAPEESGAALIHNDFKYDNLVLDPDDLSRVAAVLDWEMATIGDPLMDLGTTLGYWVDPDDPPQLRALEFSPTTLPGNPTRARVAQRYAVASGRDLGDVVFYYVYGLFKIAVIVQQIYARYCAGHTRDPRFASLIDAVRLLGRIGSQAAARGRLDRLFG